MPELQLSRKKGWPMPEPTDWIISRHTFSCQACSAWVSAGQRIARINRRWVCSRCAGES